MPDDPDGKHDWDDHKWEGVTRRSWQNRGGECAQGDTYNCPTNKQHRQAPKLHESIVTLATYATEADLTAYLQDNESVTVQPEGAWAERLLQRAERDVDRVIGPGVVNASTGLKLTPASLTTAQRAALSRATCAAVEFRLVVGEAEHVGDTEFLPVELRPLRTAGRIGPKVLEELAGSGLITWSGCASPTAA